MSWYRTPHAIHVGQWRFYPELLIAQNMHNGNLAHFTRDRSDNWVVSCVNCPADWMLKELAEWFGKWITGKVSS